MSQLSLINLIMFKENICFYTPNIQINKSLLTTIPLFLLFLLYHLSFIFFSGKTFFSLTFFSPSFPHQTLMFYLQAFQYFASALIFLHFYEFIVVTTLPTLFFSSKQYCYSFYPAYHNYLCLVFQLLYLLFPTQFLYSRLLLLNISFHASLSLLAAAGFDALHIFEDLMCNFFAHNTRDFVVMLLMFGVCQAGLRG